MKNGFGLWRWRLYRRAPGQETEARRLLGASGRTSSRTSSRPPRLDEFLQLDLREETNCQQALNRNGVTFDEVYQLAADMGGNGLHSLRPSARSCTTRADQHPYGAQRRADGRAALLFLVVGVLLPRHAARRAGDDRSRSHPRQPGQRVRLGEALRRATWRWPTSAKGDDRRIAPLPETAMDRKGRGPAGAEKAPARSAARSPRSRTAARLRLWGDGTAIRSYTYVDDMVDGIIRHVCTPTCEQSAGQHTARRSTIRSTRLVAYGSRRWRAMRHSTSATRWWDRSACAAAQLQQTRASTQLGLAGAVRSVKPGSSAPIPGLRGAGVQSGAGAADGRNRCPTGAAQPAVMSACSLAASSTPAIRTPPKWARAR